MRYLLVVLGLFCLGVLQSAALQAMAATGPASQRSSGLPVYVDGKTRLQHFYADRVWTDKEGSFEICPPESANPTYERHACTTLSDNPSGRDGWIYLSQYKQVGYFLQYVQVNETSAGPSLVLFWYPTPQVLDADKKKHN